MMSGLLTQAHTEASGQPRDKKHCLSTTVVVNTIASSQRFLSQDCQFKLTRANIETKYYHLIYLTFDLLPSRP